MVVLCYHSVDPDWVSPLTVDPQRFAQQCAWLQRHRDVVPARELVRAVVEGGRVSRRVAALTFDDGFAALYDHAVPALTSQNLPATIFLVAATLEGARGRADWLRPRPPVAPQTLSREQVLELQARGFEFGSHSWAHRDLTRLSEAECVDDLRTSREALEDLLRRPVSMLAYPYGFHAPHVRRAAEEAGYAFALSLPEEREATGQFAVPRVGVYRDNGIMAIRVKSTRWYFPARMSSLYSAAWGTRRGARLSQA